VWDFCKKAFPATLLQLQTNETTNKRIKEKETESEGEREREKDNDTLT